MRGKYLMLKLIMRNRTDLHHFNHLLYDKSMKFGTQWEHDMKIILSNKKISNLTPDLCGSFLFQIADKSSTLFFIDHIHNMYML